jgi:hypothetical protein
MSKLLKDSFVFAKQLGSFQASREVYFLFAVAKALAFTCGFIAGRLL